MVEISQYMRGRLTVKYSHYHVLWITRKSVVSEFFASLTHVES